MSAAAPTMRTCLLSQENIQLDKRLLNQGMLIQVIRKQYSLCCRI